MYLIQLKNIPPKIYLSTTLQFVLLLYKSENPFCKGIKLA